MTLRMETVSEYNLLKTLEDIAGWGGEVLHVIPETIHNTRFNDMRVTKYSIIYSVKAD